MKKTIIKIVLIFLILNIKLFSQSLQGIWVVRDMLNSKKGIDELVDYANKNNIDYLFVQVRGRGTVYYKSQYEDFALQKLDYDPLQYIIEKCRNTNIKVHAWFNTYLIWSKDKPPTSNKHPYNKFQDFLLKDVNLNGYSSKMNKIAEGYYLSPANYEVNKYLLKLIQELVTNYNIDGIHFDYIRYPNSNFIGEKKMIDYLSNKYGFSPLLLKKYPKKVINLKSEKENLENLEKIQELYSESINKFLKQLNLWLQNNYPKTIISAAVKPNPVIAKIKFFQDWINWIDSKYVDFVVIMNYTNEYSIFERNLYKIKSTVDISKIMVGLGCYNKESSKIRNQIKLARKMNFGSFCFFSYKHLKNKSLQSLLKK